MRKLVSDSRRAHSIGLALVTLLSIELAMAIVFSRCPALNAMPWDVGTMFDGGYRLLHGQKPHVDFYSPLGLLPLLIVAGGMKIGSPFTSCYAYAHSILLPLLALWAWALLRTRTSAFFAGLVALWIGVVAVTPRSLGYPPPLLSYSMQYNRWGWALLLIACIELFIPRRAVKFSVIAAISTGAIAGLLLFLKINYFAAVAIAVAIRFVWYGPDWKWLACAASAFVAVAGAGFWYLDFHFAAFLGDLQLLASVQTLSARAGNMLRLFFANGFDLWLLSCTVLVAVICRKPNGGTWKSRAWLWAAPVSLAALGILTCSANFQNFEIPLFSFAAFVTAEQLRRCLPDGQDRTKMAYLAVCLIAVGMIGNTLYQDVATLAAAKSSRTDISAAGDGLSFEAGPLRDMPIDPPVDGISAGAIRGALRAGAVTWREDPGEAYPYVPWVNDGVRLLRAHTGSQSHVFVMDLSNPFSLSLGLTPPRGDALFWHYRRDFDATHFPPPARVFREVTHVMVPKAPIQRATTMTLQQIYSRVLATEFARAGESDLWLLYERRH